MATNTTNYGWTKPDYEDDADIMVINETIDDIDAQVKSNESNITALDSRTGFGIEIPENANLNAYTTIGEYYCGTAARAATLINLPDVAKAANGRLVVKALNSATNNRLIQIWYCNFSVNTTKGIVLMRQLATTDTWTNWFLFTGTEIIPST